MATLYSPTLSPNPSSLHIAAEITFCQSQMEDLDPHSDTYMTDKAYYEQKIEEMVERLDGVEAQGTDNQPYGNEMGGGYAASPGDATGSSASSSYLGSHSALSSPADSMQASSRKRSLGSMGGYDVSDSKRYSLTGSPALTPAAPASPHIFDPNHAVSYGHNQRQAPASSIPYRASRPTHYLNQQASASNSTPVGHFRATVPYLCRPEPLATASTSNIIDLTEEEAPVYNMGSVDLFSELEQAYRGPNVPSPANAFNQDHYMNPEELAQFLITPTQPGDIFGLGNLLGPNAVSHTAQTPAFAPAFGPAGIPGLLKNEDANPSRNIVLERELFGDDLDDLSDAGPAPNPDAIAKLIENIKPDEETPPELREPTPAGMSSTLLEHQKLGLAWLKKMEEGSNKGGILADEMGLGKTVQALALILARPSNDPICKTTLIIAPVALMRQWEKEIQRHVHFQHRLKVHIYHGNGKKADFNKLRQFDVVLTTFGTLGSELKQKESRKEAEYVQKELANPNYRRPAKDQLALIGPRCMWYRVIIDEAQCIKNKSTLVSKASSELQAQHRLCMTGTPMMNSIEELYPLIRFLRIKPYNDWMSFSANISKQVKDSRRREVGMKRVQALLRSIMLRRQKTTVVDGKEICQIPPKHTHHQSVEFEDDEHKLYKAIETKSQLKFNKYLEKGTVSNNYAYILVLLLRLRQACCHPHLIKDLGVQVATEGIAENDLLNRARELKEDVVNRLKQMQSSECPICLDGVPNPTIFLPCGHTCCGECFQKLVDPAQAIREGNEDAGARCPHCREKLSSTKITDYRHFCKVFCPDKAAQLFGDQDDGSGSESDSEDDSSDDSDDDEVNNNGDLAEFVVPDDASEDDFEPPSHLGAAGPKASKKKGKGKGKARANSKVTLAQLKKQSLRNKAAKKKYLKRLRKTWKTSSKIEKTLELISQILVNDPTEKILVFSQFTSLLDLLEVPLDERKYKYQRYDGSMRMDDRAEAVNQFMDDSDQQLMLISLKAGNAGLNLNKASQVIMLDPFWNPYIEDQAVDRAHRMPQKREVHVHRLLVPQTVEDRICDLQEKKRELITSALDEKEGKSISRLSLNDLMYLFGMGRH